MSAQKEYRKLTMSYKPKYNVRSKTSINTPCMDRNFRKTAFLSASPSARTALSIRSHAPNVESARPTTFITFLPVSLSFFGSFSPLCDKWTPHSLARSRSSPQESKSFLFCFLSLQPKKANNNHFRALPVKDSGGESVLFFGEGGEGKKGILPHMGTDFFP